MKTHAVYQNCVGAMYLICLRHIADGVNVIELRRALLHGVFLLVIYICSAGETKSVVSPLDVSRFSCFYTKITAGKNESRHRLTAPSSLPAYASIDYTITNTKIIF